MRPNAPTNPYDVQNPAKIPQPNPLHDPRNPAGYPFRFSNPGVGGGQMSPAALQQQQQQHPLSQFMHQQHALSQPHHMTNYGSRFPFMQPQQQQQTQIPISTTVGLTSTTTTVNSSVPPTPGQDKNWQDGLRALLPNINISFASRFKCFIPEGLYS